MRIERWYWLGVFCVISLALHAGLAYESPAFYKAPRVTKPPEIEVTLLPPEPPVEEKKAEPPIPQPKPTPPPGLTNKEIAKLLEPKHAEVKPGPVVVNPNVEKGPVRVVKVDKPAEEKRPVKENAEPGGFDKLREEKPITSGLPSGVVDAGQPNLRVAKADRIAGGGGSPAPGPILGGKGGAKGPEAPPEDIVFNGGGAGGEKLPKAAPRIGGGGGASILSVENPLAKEAIPEERPGVGPGGGGGQGQGGGGGVGVGRGLGIGTRLDGKEALATLHSKPGIGIGAGVGDKIGTRAPGGGKGTGSELPGTGGTGIGYGRGSGIGLGNGKGIGAGDGDGARPGRMRGIPFGDVTGLLKGDPNGGGGSGGGPGGPGRGAVFGSKPAGGGGGGPVHIVYVLDISGSMRDGNKLGKAKAALTKALNELKPQDTYNIIVFWGRCAAFSDTMLPATPGNVEAGAIFVDRLRTGDGTNISAAMEAAFQMEGVTHMFLMSDGEPTYGIRDFTRLRERIKDLNSDRKVRISTLALGLGENFPGIMMLHGIADDNRGDYRYVNLSGDRPE